GGTRTAPRTWPARGRCGARSGRRAFDAPKGKGGPRARPFPSLEQVRIEEVPAEEVVLEMRGIRKEFPGVVANDHVSLDIRRGEVHALLGENGAGKSTLMNILYGLYRPDSGEILLQGKRVSFSSARDAIQA